MANNKEKVLEAAMELFHDQGFRATGLDQILTASGVCKSNFYYHFKSKDELAIRVVERKIRQMTNEYIAPALDHPSWSAKEKLKGFFGNMIRFCEDNDCCRGCFLGNFTLELSDHHEEIRRRISAYFRELENRIAQVLREGQAAGEITLRGMQPHELASSVVSLLEGGLLLAKGHKETAPLKHSLTMILHFVGDEGGDNHAG